VPPPEFSVRTCEDTVLPNQNSDHFQPNPVQRPNTADIYTPFKANDPLGLRAAILPVFERQPDGTLIGLGTAVHVDGWGGLLTAEHVVDFTRDGLSLSSDLPRETDSISRTNAVVMLGLGLYLGHAQIPPWAFPFVNETVLVPFSQNDPVQDDPMAELRGESPSCNPLDLAGIFVELPGEAYASRGVSPKTLPVQVVGWEPTVGEYVLAFGYPHLEATVQVTESLKQTLIKDGLFSAYGRITCVYRNGRDRMNQTPSFEVEANWPPGMSGGPVVNELGNVIGIVSRSLLPADGLTGTGWASCLPLVPDMEQFAPRLDLNRPGWRQGYAVLADAGKVLGFYPSFDIATDYASKVVSGVKVLRCSNRIASAEYIFHT
jgi:serine protease Do